MMNIPKIRFKSFNDEWLNKKIGDLTTIRRGASPRPISDPKWFDNDSNVGWLRISDVTKQDGKIYQIKQHISKLGQDKTLVIKSSHLILSIAATVGKPAINYVSTGIHDGFVVFINPKFNIDYMFYWFTKFEKNWRKYGQPGAQINLNSDIIRSQKIYLPSLVEQHQIGAFFSKLDALISAQSKKLTLLKQLKHGYLQRMFPQAGQTIPRVRFSGFNDKWQSKKLNIMFNFYKGKGLGIQQLNGTKYPAIIYGELYTKYHEIINNVFSQSNSQGFLGYKNDLLFPGSSTVANGTAQANALMVDNVQLGGDIIIARPKQDDIDSSFMSYQINSQKFKLYPIIVGTTITHMYGKDLSKLKFMITGLLEQQKIGSLFAKLDHLIELQNHKLALLQQLKKGYLQNMFC